MAGPAGTYKCPHCAAAVPRGPFCVECGARQLHDPPPINEGRMNSTPPAVYEASSTPPAIHANSSPPAYVHAAGGGVPAATPLVPAVETWPAQNAARCLQCGAEVYGNVCSACGMRRRAVNAKTLRKYEDINFSRVKRTGFCQDYVFYLKNHQSLLSIFFVHPRNPFTRMMRVMVFLSLLCLSAFLAAVNLMATTCSDCSEPSAATCSGCVMAASCGWCESSKVCFDVLNPEYYLHGKDCPSRDFFCNADDDPFSYGDVNLAKDEHGLSGFERCLKDKGSKTEMFVILSGLALVVFGEFLELIMTCRCLKAGSSAHGLMQGCGICITCYVFVVSLTFLGVSLLLVYLNGIPPERFLMTQLQSKGVGQVYALLWTSAVFAFKYVRDGRMDEAEERAPLTADPAHAY